MKDEYYHARLDSDPEWYMALDSDPEWQHKLSIDPREQSNEGWLADYNTAERVQIMPIIAKNTGGKDFKIPDQGTHLAICNMVVHLGLQPSKNPAYKPKDTVYLRWELPHERMEWEKDGVKHEGPMVLGNFYTVSLSPKSYLRKDLEGWRAKAFTEEELKGFDILNVLGKPCLLTIVHNESGGKTYANVASVSAPVKGTAIPKAELDLIKYSADEPEQKDLLPEWLQDKIDSQLYTEDQECELTDTAQGEEFDDDIPF